MSLSARFLRCLALPALAVGLTLAPDAQANSGFSGIDAAANIVIGGIVVLAGDVVLVSADLYYLGQNKRTPLGWSIAKIVHGAPQALLMDTLSGYVAGDMNASQPLLFELTLWGATTGALTTSGAWSIAEERDPLSIYGLSWAIGANAAFTSVAVGALFGDRLPGKAAGVVAMLGTAPSIAVGLYHLADPSANRTAWGGLTGWSSVLFLHGAGSLLHGLLRDKTGKKTDVSTPYNAKALAPRVHFAPVFTNRGAERSMGVMAQGVF